MDPTNYAGIKGKSLEDMNVADTDSQEDEDDDDEGKEKDNTVIHFQTEFQFHTINTYHFTAGYRYALEYCRTAARDCRL